MANKSMQPVWIPHHAILLQVYWFLSSINGPPVDASPVNTTLCSIRDKNARIVDLSGCDLTTIPKYLKGLPNMKYLYLANNKIPCIDSSLISSLNATYINLMNNDISAIPDLENNYVKVLDLSYNKLKEPIHPSKLEGLRNLKKLNLRGNDDEMCLESQRMARSANDPYTVDCGEPTSDPETSPKSNVTSYPQWPLGLPQTPSPTSPPPSPPSSPPPSRTTTSLPAPSPQSASVTPTTLTEGDSPSTSQEDKSNQTNKLSEYITWSIIAIVIVVAIGCVFVWWFRNKGNQYSMTETNELL